MSKWLRLLLGTTMLIMGALIVVAQDSVVASSKIRVFVDDRLEALVGKPVQKQTSYRRGNYGYRLQIYNGNDRKKANEEKLKFASLFGGYRSYILFQNPNFRLRVGDFRTREEALQLMQRAKPYFSQCMIVPDQINVAKPKDTSTENGYNR